MGGSSHHDSSEDGSTSTESKIFHGKSGGHEVGGTDDPVRAHLQQSGPAPWWNHPPRGRPPFCALFGRCRSG